MPAWDRLAFALVEKAKTDEFAELAKKVLLWNKDDKPKLSALAEFIYSKLLGADRKLAKDHALAAMEFVKMYWHGEGAGDEALDKHKLAGARQRIKFRNRIREALHAAYPRANQGAEPPRWYHPLEPLPPLADEQPVDVSGALFPWMPLEYMQSFSLFGAFSLGTETQLDFDRHPSFSAEELSSVDPAVYIITDPDGELIKIGKTDLEGIGKNSKAYKRLPKCAVRGGIRKYTYTSRSGPAMNVKLAIHQHELEMQRSGTVVAEKVSCNYYAYVLPHVAAPQEMDPNHVQLGAGLRLLEQALVNSYRAYKGRCPWWNVQERGLTFIQAGAEMEARFASTPVK
jgi:hypothetical protein